MSDDRLTDFDDELMYAAGNLERDIQPPDDLWPAIEAAIEAPPQISPWTRYLAQAAAVVLLVGGSSGLTYLAVSGDRSTVTPVPQASVMPLNAVSASFGDRYTLGPDFQDAYGNPAGGGTSPEDIAQWLCRSQIRPTNPAGSSPSSDGGPER